ncbi:MAG: WD40/YVTN/BNR-like repeat-containing protein, partial [Gemmatimonadaceae bacterium]
MPHVPASPSWKARLAIATVASFVTLAAPAAPGQLAAQANPGVATAQPQLKGVWEPVSFSADIDLREVFFVTVDVGWVAGDKGTILHTKDGGRTWDAQLGGDPDAPGEKVELLRFVDERHGWAGQG